MKVKKFSQLSEMLDTTKVKLKMTKETHKYIIGIGFSIDTVLLSDETLPNKLDGIRVEHDSCSAFKTVEFIPIFRPCIGDGFTIELD